MALRLFALNDSAEFGRRVAGAMQVPLAPHEEREFEDGEHKTRPLDSVRGCDAYVAYSLYGDARRSVNDKLVRLLFFLGALRDAGAARVTAVMPYLCYARKDRRSKPRDPVSTRYLASLFEAVGADRVLTLDVHNLAAYENAFRIRAEHLEAKQAFADHFAGLLGNDPVAVVSPDIGGVKRAEAFREALERNLGRPAARGFMEKSRSEGVVSGDTLVGDIAGRSVVVIDDLISSGTTLRRAIAACRAQGARRVFAAATHGLFTANAVGLLSDPALEQLAVTDSVPPFRLDAAAQAKLRVLPVAPLFARAILQLHGGGAPSGDGGPGGPLA